MCTRPLRYWKSDIVNPDTGKFYGFITGYTFPYATVDDFIKRGLECSKMYVTKEFIEVPCGHCPECLKRNRLQWVARCLAEKETSNYSYFLTLTYDDLHLVSKPILGDIQYFINRLRKYVKCRYLVVGELGDLSNRPHYHMILFTDSPINDLVVLKRSSGFSDTLYRSSLLERCWNEKGFISVGNVNSSSIAYTIGYLVSKSKKTVFKSQSQGLGSKYFKDLNDRYFLGSGNGSCISISLPRYLKEKYGLKYEYDSVTQSLLWNNRVICSGLTHEAYRDLTDYLGTCFSHFKIKL